MNNERKNGNWCGITNPPPTRIDDGVIVVVLLDLAVPFHKTVSFFVVVVRRKEVVVLQI